VGAGQGRPHAANGVRECCEWRRPSGPRLTGAACRHTSPPPRSRRDEQAKLAAAQANAMRALRPKLAAHTTQSAGLAPLRARVGELQQQISELEAEVGLRRGGGGGQMLAAGWPGP
jgi:hypothetical protein